MLLRNIHQRRAHRRREDDVAASLGFEDLRCSLCGVECAVQVHLHDLLPLLGSVVLRRDVRGDPRVDDDDVESSKVGGNLLDGPLDLSLVADVRLVSCGPDVVRRGDFGGGRVGRFGRVVDQRDLIVSFFLFFRYHTGSDEAETYIGTCFGQSTGNFQPDATSAACPISVIDIAMRILATYPL